MTEQELEAIKLRGVTDAITIIEALTAKVREFKGADRLAVMDGLAETICNDFPDGIIARGKELYLCGLLAAAITLLAEERNKAKPCP